MKEYREARCLPSDRVISPPRALRTPPAAPPATASPPFRAYDRVLDPRFSARLSELPLGATSLVLAPEPIETGGRVLASVFGLFMLATLPQAMQDAALKADSVEHLIASGTRWHPSVALAEYLVRLLSASHEVIM